MHLSIGELGRSLVNNNVETLSSVLDMRAKDQFPMCHADLLCPTACRVKMDSAIKTCLSFINEQADTSIDDCRNALAFGRKSCSENESDVVDRCYSSIAEGFHHLGVPRDTPAGKNA